MSFALFRFTALAVLSASMALGQAPDTPKRPVTDTYHGVTVTDNYRWLERDADPEVKAWSAAQNRYARTFLDAQPMRAALQSQLATLYGSSSSFYPALRYRNGWLFALKSQPPKEQPLLVWMKSANDPATEKIVLDPNQIDAQGGTEIDFFEPSCDGKLVAVSLSQGGSESGDVHVYDASTGQALPDVVPHVNNGTAGGSVAWNQDGSGFYYTRYPHAGERPPADMAFYQQVWFHKLGMPIGADTYSLGKDFPRIAEILLSTSDDGRFVLAQMANGDGGEFAHYLLGPDGQWTQITHLADSVTQAVFGGNDSLWLVSRQGSPMGKILRLPLATPHLADAKTVVPESKFAIQEIVATPHRLYAVDQAGGPMQVRVFDEKGASKGLIPLAPSSSVSQVVGLDSDDALVLTETYLQPPAWSRFDAAASKLQATSLRRVGAADYSDTEVIREFAVSKDGTRVPLSIIRRKGTKLDGNNPVVLYGYGGYGISLAPSYNIALRPLLDHGVIYAIANLRGGSEYGEDWHRAGMLTRKQNVFDDFAACAKWLIDEHYTNPKRLAIEGGSNGGLLMGAALTQHPEFYAAVVAHVGIYDMLRVELSPNGAFNVTEFGTVKEGDQFKALYAYSPYHHVLDGVQYPAVLFLTGANDPRVEPANSRKMTARLQQAGGTRQPVYLRTTDSAGHGIGTALSERIAQAVDVDAFLFATLGVK
jgi:prolyl oligopeptidase